jgi:cbb3-type cytochrome oxidase maturation protein
MSVIYIVLPLAFLLAGVALTAFMWMVRDGQLDDLDSPQIRMLFDDAPAKSAMSHSKDMDVTKKRQTS